MYKELLCQSLYLEKASKKEEKNTDFAKECVQSMAEKFYHVVVVVVEKD